MACNHFAAFVSIPRGCAVFGEDFAFPLVAVVSWIDELVIAPGVDGKVVDFASAHAVTHAGLVGVDTGVDVGIGFARCRVATRTAFWKWVGFAVPAEAFTADARADFRGTHDHPYTGHCGARLTVGTLGR